MTKISLVIPVYAARDTIVPCLASVLSQTMDDVETILVDDHGPDDSIATARDFLKEYDGPKQFRFIETMTNSGPGAARNKGIEAAAGEYIAFLDSDDRIEPSFCEKMYRAASAVRADLACCDALMHEGTDTRELHNPYFTDGPLDEKTRSRIMRSFVTYLWTYLFRREFLTENHIRFPAFRSAEDTCLVCCCWLSASRAARIQEALYNYTATPQSLSRRPDPTRWRQRLSSLRSFERYARDSGLYRGHRCLIRRLVFKKGWLLAARDYLEESIARRKASI